MGASSGIFSSGLLYVLLGHFVIGLLVFVFVKTIFKINKIYHLVNQNAATLEEILKSLKK